MREMKVMQYVGARLGYHTESGEHCEEGYSCAEVKRAMYKWMSWVIGVDSLTRDSGRECGSHTCNLRI